MSGDFGGPKAIRAIGAYLKEHGGVVSAFYVSNVEQYLFQDGKQRAFYDNVATLPLNDVERLHPPVLDASRRRAAAVALWHWRLHPVVQRRAHLQLQRLARLSEVRPKAQGPRPKAQGPRFRFRFKVQGSRFRFKVQGSGKPLVFTICRFVGTGGLLGPWAVGLGPDGAAAAAFRADLRRQSATHVHLRRTRAGSAADPLVDVDRSDVDLPQHALRRAARDGGSQRRGAGEDGERYLSGRDPRPADGCASRLADRERSHSSSAQLDPGIQSGAGTPRRSGERGDGDAAVLRRRRRDASLRRGS